MSENFIAVFTLNLSVVMSLYLNISDARSPLFLRHHSYDHVDDLVHNGNPDR